jgi:uncharacterized protein (TIGR02147 family)
MPDIYQYIDYRAYLRDYFAESKKSNPAFSHMFFAKKAGINSSGFVHLAMNGKRNLTKPVLLKIARAIGLNAEQTEYFEDVYFNFMDNISNPTIVGARPKYIKSGVHPCNWNNLI